MAEHDNANYGRTFYYRGNVMLSVTEGSSTCASYYITGASAGTYEIFTGARSGATLSAARNYAVPGAITANNFATTLGYNSFLGLTSATGPNGDTMNASYDGAARPSQTVSPRGAVTGYSYSPNGTYPATQTATTNGHWVKTTLDGLGRTIKVETGDATSTKSVVDTGYDSCACSPIGKMKRVSQPHAPGGAVYWTTYNYDYQGRTLSVVSADGASTTTYAYLGNTTTVTDPAGKWKKYVSDALGNLTQVIEPNVSGGAGVIPVFGTGVSAAGGLAADGSADSHYKLISSADPSYPGPTAYVVNNGWWVSA